MFGGLRGRHKTFAPKSPLRSRVHLIHRRGLNNRVLAPVHRSPVSQRGTPIGRSLSIPVDRGRCSDKPRTHPASPIGDPKKMAGKHPCTPFEAPYRIGGSERGPQCGETAERRLPGASRGRECGYAANKLARAYSVPIGAHPSEPHALGRSHDAPYGCNPIEPGWRLSVLLTGLLLGCTSSEKARSGGEEAPVMDGPPEHTDTATDPTSAPSMPSSSAGLPGLPRHECRTERWRPELHRRPTRGEPGRGDLSKSGLLGGGLSQRRRARGLRPAAHRSGGSLCWRADAECSPTTMPLGGTSTMSREDVDCIEQWIRDLDAPETEPPDVTFPAPALTVLTRVKYLLDGGALTADELALGSGPDGELSAEGLEALVDDWMSGDRFRAKRRQFLQLHLQQTPSDGNYYNQFRNTRTNSLTPIREALNESQIRTAERIIDDGEDFRSIVTTNTWEMTTTTSSRSRWRTTPWCSSPTGCGPRTTASTTSGTSRTTTTPVRPRGGQRGLAHRDPRSLRLDRHDDRGGDARSGQRRAPARHPGRRLDRARTPRVGFFSSPAFFQTWLTNRDNDFRVTINQAMIVATGMTFSPGDSTPLTGDGAAVDADLFPASPPATAATRTWMPCPAFLANYDNVNTRHTVPETTLPQAGFSFQGQSVEVNSLQEWPRPWRTTPTSPWRGAKLCQWRPPRSAPRPTRTSSRWRMTLRPPVMTSLSSSRRSSPRRS